MSKKDYETLARALAGLPSSDNSDRLVRLADVVETLGRVCEEGNARFNWAKWYEACGLTT